MTPEAAASLIRIILANEMKLSQANYSTIYRKWLGTTRKQMVRKKLLISNKNSGIHRKSDDYKTDAFVCFWYLTNNPDTARDIYLQQGAGVVLGVAGGIAGTGAFGATARTISDMTSAKDTASTLLSPITGATSGIHAQLGAAWRAGQMSSVIGTRHEFAFRIDEALINGCAAISGTGNNVKVTIRTWETKRQFMNFMGYAEEKGQNTQASFKYIRDISDSRVWEFSESSGSIVKVR